MTGLLGFFAVLIVALAGAAPAGAAGTSLRFHGTGSGDVDRLKIAIDDPANVDPGPPADVGATDFTVEFWMKAFAAENTAATVACGANVDWIFGNVIVDRDRFDQDRKVGISVAGGRIVFGVSGSGTGDRTICGTSNVLDGGWHHVAVQRRPGGTGPFEYRFWRFDPIPAPGVWTMVRDYAASNAFVWTPAPTEAGQHAFAFWVRRTGSTADWEAYLGTSTFTIVP